MHAVKVLLVECLSLTHVVSFEFEKLVFDFHENLNYLQAPT